MALTSVVEPSDQVATAQTQATNASQVAEAELLINEDRHFALEELFFSCTDKRGFITACNPVFVRVSAFDVKDLIGAPHSVIRHPDTPRAVFKVLWDALKANKPLAAYVKNRAADGRYYWVLGLAVPVRRGYLSIRLKPSSGAQSKIESAYAKVRDLENRLSMSGLSRSDVLDRSVPALLDELESLGFADYEAFQQYALPAEIASRRAKLGPDSVKRVSTADRTDSHTPDEDRTDAGIALANQGVLDWVYKLFDNLDELVRVNEDLARRSSILLDLAKSIHIFALNAGLASTMVGPEGRTLEAITKQLQETSKQIVGTINRSTAGVDDAIALIREVGFMISISTLESELVSYVTAAEEEDDGVAMNQQVGTLVEALLGSVERVFGLSEQIVDTVGSVSKAGKSLFSLMELLRFELLAGRIEISRLRKPEAFNNMFGEISARLVAAAPEIQLFGEDIATAASLIEQFELDQGRQALARMPDVASV